MQTKKILITCAIYNQEKYISRCLESILMQRGDYDFDLFLIDNYSTDNTREIIEKTLRQHSPNPRRKISLLYNDRNYGVKHTFQRLLKMMACSSAEYSCELDGDDFWCDPYRLLECIDYLNLHEDLPMCVNANYLYYQDEDRYTLHALQEQIRVENVSRITSHQMASDNPIPGFSGSFYRTSAIKKLPKFAFTTDVSISDWALHLLLSLEKGIGFLPRPMSVYRIHKQSIYQNTDRSKGPSEAFTIIKKYLHQKYNREFDEDLKQFENIYYK